MKKQKTDPKARRLKRQRRKVIGRRIFLIVLALIATAILAAGIYLGVRWFMNRKPPETLINPENETLISIAFAGDLNITDKVVESGAVGDSYDYTEVFKDVLPLLADADQTVLNFEGNLCGAPYGTEHASAPPELLSALSAAGVDMLQVANSSAIDNGLLGLSQTLSAIHSAGLDPLGAYASPEEFSQSRGFLIKDIQGVKVAFVAFTKGMDNLALPEGQEDCVNLLYTDYTSSYQKIDTVGITRILEAVEAESPDLTVALLHWGSEYNAQISASQERLVSIMHSGGVDVIVGTHSHYVQELTFDQEKNRLVAYSLGDFLGDADRVASSYSAVLKVQIAKDKTTGNTRIAGFTYDPIYTFSRETEMGISTRLLRIRQSMEKYEANGVTDFSEDVYQAMKRANDRVDKLFTPVEEEEK